MLLPKPIRDRWALALTHYEQARGSLRLGDRFCCLGVLCDIERPALWVGTMHDHASGVPSFMVTRDLGTDAFELEAFAVMNDKLLWGFDQIRELIERDPDRAELHALAQLAENVSRRGEAYGIVNLITDHTPDWYNWRNVNPSDAHQYKGDGGYA